MIKLPVIPSSSWRFTTPVYVTVIVSWTAYALLTVLSPQSGAARFHLGVIPFVLLSLTVIIPVHVVWLMAARGATAFKSYALMIKGSTEAKALDLIADGLLFTLVYLIATSILGALLPYLSGHTAYNIVVVGRDHLAAALSLVAFFTLYRGSEKLRRMARFETWSTTTHMIMVGFGIFAIALVLEFTRNQAAAQAMVPKTTLGLVPADTLLFTLVLPYLVAWFLGILTCINIGKFAAKVPGILYRLALRDLALGLWVVIIFSMVIQVFVFAANYFQDLSLPSILALIYALLVLYGLGFLLVRAGANKLARLEAS